MSKVYLISDHHFGHENVRKFEPSRKGQSINEHDEWLIDAHNSVVKKRDLTYFLGDVCFGQVMHMHDCIKQMQGRKVLVMGNHDNYEMAAYEAVFDNVLALKQYSGKRVFTHVPIHPSCMDRWKLNFHGHIHSLKAPDGPYVNVCVEQCEGVPRTIDQWIEASATQQ